MIKLHQFKRALNVANASPFCMKVETYLRLAKIDYKIVEVDNPSKLPKGKAPLIEHESRKIADSAHILTYLADHFSPTLDEGLDPEQAANCHAIARLLEERFYWAMLYERWIDDRCWPTIRDTWFGAMPRLIRPVISAMVRRDIRKRLDAQGLGRHTPAEIYDFAREDIDAVATSLGEKPYFTGAAPRTIDAVVYAFVANAIDVPFSTELETVARAHPNLVAYSERMRVRCFPDL